MTAMAGFQLAIYMIALLLLVKPLGSYMAHVYEGTSIVNRVFAPVERAIYRVFGTRVDVEMNWKTYALAFMVFNVLGLLVVYVLQRLQTSLPLNQALDEQFPVLSTTE